MGDLGVAQFREHGQREALGAGLLGDGELARAVAEIGEAFLLMEGQGLVDPGADLACL